MTFLMAIGYLFIMFPILSLAIILFLLIAIALTIVFSVLGYSNYLKEQEKNILLIKKNGTSKQNGKKILSI